MQNLLTSGQMRNADAFTIQKMGLSAIELMEKAASAFVEVFSREVVDREQAIAVVCGQGNNGADGLAIARLLAASGYRDIKVYLTQFSERETEEYQTNLKRLKMQDIHPVLITAATQLDQLNAAVIVDAVLGSGLNKPLEAEYRELALLINKSGASVIAVDVPSGFPSEDMIPEELVCVHADLVICFQRPKINFFFPESTIALKKFIVANIGLDEEFIQLQESPYQLVDSASVCRLIKPRQLFTHKGTYGHALIIAGQQQTMGAALLAARGCLHTGAGLTTLSIPQGGLTALNVSLPEVMFLSRDELADNNVLGKFKAVAIGPGLGTGENSIELVEVFLTSSAALVLDADALHILGERRDLLALLPNGAILTPHKKEFDHLFGLHDSWWERLQTARKQAQKLHCTIVLKNQYTFIVSSYGQVYINPTGNPAMAQGGMGDVLTGIIVSLLAQGYARDEAAIIACYLHGASGDELAKGQATVTASAVSDGISALLKGLIK